MKESPWPYKGFNLDDDSQIDKEEQQPT